MTQTGSHYIHGTSPEEQKRLSLMNRLLNERSLQEISLRSGDRVLDVGAGLGEFSALMAAVSGRAVVAVERSEEQIVEGMKRIRESGHESRVEFRQGDALALPLTPQERGAFDVAHARFLLEHVPDPLSVVKEMVRAVRPGGRVILEDDDHDVLRLWPEPPGFEAVWKAYMRTYDRNGNDPLIGRRLVKLLYDAGAAPVRNSWIFFGSCAGTPEFRGFVENLIGVVWGARQSMITASLVEESHLDSVVTELRKWGERPDSSLWYAMAWAEGIKVPGRGEPG